MTITLYFRLQPQYKYDLFHINFTMWTKLSQVQTFTFELQKSYVFLCGLFTTACGKIACGILIFGILIGYHIFSNYWMRLSRIWRILQNKEGVIHRGLSASVDNTLRDLQNSSYPTKAEFNNCFVIHSKYFPVLNGVSPFCSLFSAQQNHNLAPRFFRSTAQ